MKISKLRLSGFKSFVEPATLHIEPGLTGVVGPNGCGKSNLLEAIRWVMGENSPKSMRSGGMEDVIFAGTQSRPQRDFGGRIIRHPSLPELSSLPRPPARAFCLYPTPERPTLLYWRAPETPRIKLARRTP